tara:strand:- start:4548 stop:4841 length:294 start_codon:yes stop_codon:yes gene_type:complete
MSTRLTDDDLAFMTDVVAMYDATDDRATRAKVKRCYLWLASQAVTRQLDALTRDFAKTNKVSESTARKALSEWRKAARADLMAAHKKQAKSAGSGTW